MLQSVSARFLSGFQVETCLSCYIRLGDPKSGRDTNVLLRVLKGLALPLVLARFCFVFYFGVALFVLIRFYFRNMALVLPWFATLGSTTKVDGLTPVIVACSDHRAAGLLCAATASHLCGVCKVHRARSVGSAVADNLSSAQGWP